MTNGASKKTKHALAVVWQPLILVVLVVTGVTLHVTGALDWQVLLEKAQGYTGYWWLAALLIMIQVLLFTFALPGSSLLWVVAPLYSPATATLILVTGSVLGALTAYWFARRRAFGWSGRIRSSQSFRLLERRADFLTLCALRVMPNFPHSIINYGAGVLRVPIGQFVASTLIGLTLKSYLYANVVHNAVTAEDPARLMQLETWGPLGLLAILMAVAAWFRARW
jgi:uncharacterized membrane protein YdjX (TVP38/TMEM64 family)